MLFYTYLSYSIAGINILYFLLYNTFNKEYLGKIYPTNDSSILVLFFSYICNHSLYIYNHTSLHKNSGINIFFSNYYGCILLCHSLISPPIFISILEQLTISHFDTLQTEKKKFLAYYRVRYFILETEFIGQAGKVFVLI